MTETRARRRAGPVDRMRRSAADTARATMSVVSPPAPLAQAGAEQPSPGAAHAPATLERRRQDVALRAADIAIAGGVLAVTLPVTLSIAALTRLLDGSPVLYRGERLGLGGRTFAMYKFR